MAILTLTTEQQQVLNSMETPMDDAFGDGIASPIVPPYEKYKPLDPKYKALIKNAYKSLVAALLKGLSATPSYTNVSYQNGFSAWGDAAYSGGQVRYYRDALGFVHVEGLIRTPSSPAANATMFTLPVGLRPAASDARIFPAVSNDLFASIQVSSDGTVVYRGLPAANTWCSLNLVFKTP